MSTDNLAYKMERYFKLKKFALLKIEQLVTPVDAIEQEFYYSAYFYHLVSIIDQLCENEFEEKLEKSFGDAEKVSYIRNLRNESIHRGEKVDRIGGIYDGKKLEVYCPNEVSDRRKKKFIKTSWKSLSEIINFCEQRIGPLCFELLQEKGFFSPSQCSSEDFENEIKKQISLNELIPDWVKNISQNASFKIDADKICRDSRNAIKCLLSNK